MQIEQFKRIFKKFKNFDYSEFENFHKFSSKFKNSHRKMKLKIKFIIKIVVKSNVKGILNSQFLTPKLLVSKFLIDGTIFTGVTQ